MIPNGAAQVHITGSHLNKTYHVQIDQVASATFSNQSAKESRTDDGDFWQSGMSVCFAAASAYLARNVLDEGRNRHIRRLLASLGVAVLRVVPGCDRPVAARATSAKERPPAVLPKRKTRHSTRLLRDKGCKGAKKMAGLALKSGVYELPA